MLEDYLNEIYQKAMTLELLKETSFYSSMRNVDTSRDIWNEATKYLEQIIRELRESDLKKGTKLLNSSYKAQGSYGNWHEFSSVIDGELIPQIVDYLKQYVVIDATEDEWTLKSSSTGFLTLKNEKKGYLHSSYDPMWEGYLYAYNIYQPEYNCYYILGAGLGYPAYQLWRMSGGEADIYIFEIDKDISTYADLYGVVNLIDSNKLHIITGDDKDEILEEFFKNLPNTSLIRTVYYWDSSKYNGIYSDYIVSLLASEVTSRVFKNKWINNYELNSKLEHKWFSDFDTSLSKDEWLVVGSGPSLNDNLEFIKESLGKRTICVVNSSLKWFSLHGIRPDLCTVCDPTDLLVPHIEGLESFSVNVPLIADCIANSKYMELYKGDKYYVFSTSSAFAVGIDRAIGDIWNIGGTVTSMALEVACRMGAKKVYLIGADLAYPDNVTFADGVAHDVEEWTSDKLKVVSVDDKLIPTSELFVVYKSMIEPQVELYSNVEVVNKSLHGAYIKGTFCNKWWETLPCTNSSKDYLIFFEELKKDSLLLNWRNKYYIFWQILERAISCGCDFSDDEKEVISESYAGIYEAFKAEINYSVHIDGKVNDDLTYIFTDDFQNNNDVKFKKLFKIAKDETLHHKNVLIINSVEYLGGEKVPIHNSAEYEYNESLKISEKVFYGNDSFSYFQFPQGMPDVQHYKVFLDSIADTKPGKIIIGGKYSLLADFCGEYLGVKTVIRSE